MSIKNLKNQLGDHARDIRINLDNVLQEAGAPGLNPKQIAGIALASAYASRSEDVVKAIHGEVTATLSAEEVAAAKSAATIMAMNNVYYRFIHLVSDQQYGKLPANLRMQVIGNPGIEKVDFELYALAVSAINGCGMCMDAHVREVIKAGIPPLGVQSAIRIASVVNAAAQGLAVGALEQAAA